ncbi:hypothetical protein SO802_015690 [Lithocarpus litseifolius]|uniref:Uncharacterized protein n=1 Tax=Lithocarpus litseifolius TaxID=425828 RepID=A0AAW2CVP2_9ROSI
MDVFRLFTRSYRVDSHSAKFPLLLHFVKRNMIPWVLKWQYKRHEDDVHARHWYVKWWDSFPHIQNIVTTVTRECSVYAAPSTARDYTSIQAPVQAEMPSPSLVKNVKPFVKPKKKSSPLEDLQRDPNALFALLKCAEELVANRTSGVEKESKASSEESVANNPYFPYDQKLFGHDEDSPDQGDIEDLLLLLD